MSLVRLIFRWAVLLVGAVIGLGLFLFAVAAFVVILLLSLLTGRKPNLQFRMNKNPWTQRRPAPQAAGDVVDIEAREVREPAPLPLQPPRH
ncbi:MgtC/SapB family protein [Roseateles sp. LKC17W]|uniref:MgtC/SapB family protein n=1 Tax=Pelomonas margarita TaxID=3299031 RepID=A0ABW7FC07_9BURK